MKRKKLITGLCEWQCNKCKGKLFVLIDTNPLFNQNNSKDLVIPYYYHYSEDYKKGCRQRIDFKDIWKCAKLVEWGVVKK